MMHVEDWTVWNESRRALLLGLGAGSFLLAVVRLQPARAANKYGGDNVPDGLRDDPLLLIEIAPDGAVTIVCIRSEMGQGVRTSIAMVLADELGADLATSDAMEIKIPRLPQSATGLRRGCVWPAQRPA